MRQFRFLSAFALVALIAVGVDARSPSIDSVFVLVLDIAVDSVADSVVWDLAPLDEFAPALSSAGSAALIHHAYIERAEFATNLGPAWTQLRSMRRSARHVLFDPQAAPIVVVIRQI